MLGNEPSIIVSQEIIVRSQAVTTGPDQIFEMLVSSVSTCFHEFLCEIAYKHVKKNGGDQLTLTRAKQILGSSNLGSIWTRDCDLLQKSKAWQSKQQAESKCKINARSKPEPEPSFLFLFMGGGCTLPNSLQYELHKTLVLSANIQHDHRIRCHRRPPPCPQHGLQKDHVRHHRSSRP